MNRQFLERFIAPALESFEQPIRLDDVADVRVRLNVWDEGGEGCTALDAGENDIDVTVDNGTTLIRILIEDRVWAEFQPDQARRYRARAAARPATVAILVPPGSRLDAIAEHVGLFHATHTLEKLAAWLDEDANAGEANAKRLRWRAQLLGNLAVRHALKPPKPDHPPTVRFTEYCAKWLAANAPAAIPDRKSLRTAGTGWLWFKQPKGLGYKCTNGIVDLYVSDEGFKVGLTSSPTSCRASVRRRDLRQRATREL